MALHLVTGYKGTAHISAEDVGAFNAGTFGSGEYVLVNGNMFAVESITNNNLKILDGDAMMQGRHITLKAGTYEDVTIANGEVGKNRNDLIVIRYTKDAQTGVENASFAVVQGEASIGTPTDPEITTGDILSGNCLIHEMPLYRIPVTEFSLGTPEKLFKTSMQTTNRIVCGTYKGDGAESRFVDLGFTPDAVFVTNSNGETANFNHFTGIEGGDGQKYHGGLALKNAPCGLGDFEAGTFKTVEIVNNGFNVCYKLNANNSSASVARRHYLSNVDGRQYYYIAFNLTGG